MGLEGTLYISGQRRQRALSPWLQAHNWWSEFRCVEISWKLLTFYYYWSGGAWTDAERRQQL